MIGSRRRYLTAQEFTSYCSKLNVELMAFDRELELYEKDGVLFPVARMLMPDEYVVKRYELDLYSDSFGQEIPNFPELERLLYSPTILEYINDRNLWHHIDREFEKTNLFLARPAEEQYEPWQDYRVMVREDPKLFKKSAKHYYHYYQVYQVYAIQKKYPIYAKHYSLLQNVKDEYTEFTKHLTPQNGNQIAAMHGNLICFEALSFFIEIYENEHHRTFDPIPENSGIKTLNDQQFMQYKNRLEKHAKFILKKFELTDDDIYKFLLYLLNLHENYKRSEHLKLANELLVDIQYLITFIAFSTNLSFNDIEIEINQRDPSIWTKQKFRHLDEALEVYDYARETFERLMKDYNTKVDTSFNVSPNDIEKLLKFIEKQGIFIIPFAIYDIDKILNGSRPFYSTSLYIGLSNLTTGLESYLREIANRSNLRKDTELNTLHRLITNIFKDDWGNRFNQEHSVRKNTLGNDPFLYLTDVYTDPNLDEVIKAFLIAYRSRNFIAHNFTLEQDLYHTWYGIIYTAICNALFYSWIYATKNNWI